ncbi:MAG: glycosyltransferase [Candidatus Neomarinimicrobiota bacterium]
MITAISLALIVLLGILVKLPFLSAPLDRDYGIYGYHALFWLQGRKTPYRDTNENHPPGRWLLYAALLKLFPVSRALFRYSNLVFATFTGIVAFYIAYFSYGPVAGATAALLFTVLISLPVFVWIQSNDEIQQVFFSGLALLLLLNAGSFGAWLLVLVGLVSFLAILFKQSAYINTVPVVFLSLYFSSVEFWFGAAWIALGLTAGFLATYLFYRRQGIPDTYYVNTFGFSRAALTQHLNNIHFTRRVQAAPTAPAATVKDSEDAVTFKAESDQAQKIWTGNLYRRLFNQTGWFILAALLGPVLSWIGVTGTGSGSPAIWFWLLAAVATVLLNRHLMPYHFIPLALPLAILSGAGLAAIFNLVSVNLGTAGVILLSVLLLAALAGIYWRPLKAVLARELEQRGQVYANSPEERTFYLAGEGVGRYLASVTEPEDEIYQWGSEYEIYLWAGRPSPTWDLFCPRLQVSFTTDPRAAEQFIVGQLQARPPRYIVIAARSDDNQRFREFVATEYVLERKMYGEIEIHYHRETAALQVEATGSQQKPPLASIIILTWNGIDYTRKCVESIRTNTRYPYEIIFVDNGSSDGTREYLADLVAGQRNFQLIANAGNHGFAAGNNQGMAAARGDYLVLLNNDVLVPEGWLERLVNCARLDQSIGLVGPLTNRISGLQMVADVPYTDPADSFEYSRRIAQAQRGRYTPRRRIAGFALLIRRSLYDHIGGLDERFGSGNYEDDDYCLRATAAGYKIMVAEDVFIHHFGSASFTANSIDYAAAIDHNRQLFRLKWPHIDLDHLLERDQTLVRLNDYLAVKGQAALEAADYNQARSAYGDILVTNPIDVRALYGRGLADQFLGNLSGARTAFGRVLELMPEFAGAHNSLGALQLQAGEYSAALATLVKAVKLEPDNAVARINLAEALVATDRSEKAIVLYQAVLADEPDRVDLLNRLAELLQAAGRATEALLCCERLLRLEPENAFARQMLRGTGR